MDDVFKKWEVVIQAALLRAKMAMGRVRSGSQIPIIDKEDIVKQSKVLITDYIDDRLIRSGLNMKQRKVTASTLYTIKENSSERKNVTIQTLQGLLDKRNDSDRPTLSVEDVSKVLICVGEYLELRHNGLYTDILQQLDVRSIADTNLNSIFMNVGQEIFATGISWAKIVSLFAFAGGLAVDCVLGGSPMHVGRVKSWTNEFIQTVLMEWIQNEGGWVGMFDYFMTREEPPPPPGHFYWILSTVILVLCVIFTAISVVYFRRT